MARRTTKQSNELKQEVIKLHQAGRNYKQISAELKVTPKTVGKWLKPYVKSVTAIQEIQTKLIKKINKELANDSANAKDLLCLFQSLKICKNTEIV